MRPTAPNRDFSCKNRHHSLSELSFSILNSPLNFHLAEGEADSLGGDFFAFRYAVLPVFLGYASHDEEAAVLEKDFMAQVEGFMFESKRTFCAEAQRGDGGIRDERFFVVAMPAHALVAIVVEIEQAGVESVRNA